MNSLHFMNSVECLRFFADHQNARLPYIGSKHLKVDSPEWIYSIADAQENGGGVFYSVNQTDGIGASAANITCVRSYFVDIDKPEMKSQSLLDLISAPLQPSAIVDTRNGVHAYWYAKEGEPTDPRLFGQVEIGLIRRFGGDPQVKDIARVLRLPGTYHLKDPDDDYLIKIIHQLPNPPYYSRDELLEAYPAPAPKEYHVEIRHAPRAWKNIVEDLASWDPVPGMRNRVLLVSAGVAISFGVDRQTFCDMIYEVAREWPTGRNMWNEVQRVARWAYQRGNPIRYTALRTMGVPLRSNIYE